MCIYILVYRSYIAKMESWDSNTCLYHLKNIVKTYRQAPRFCILKFNQPLGQCCIANMCNPELINYKIQHTLFRMERGNEYKMLE